MADRRQTIIDTQFNEGDFAIAVRFYERVASDPERRTFVAGGRGLINSTELRATKFDVPEKDALSKLVLR